MKFPSVEIEKRDRDEHTDTLIKSLLDEEKTSKKQKRGSTHENVDTRPAVQGRKGKTFAEIEAEEGGPIKESLVGMAHTKRALDRKRRDLEIGDTDVVTNTERYEMDTLDVEQEDGITFEPFNLKQEREEGYFDEAGNYVLRKQARGEEGEDEKDAWLNSEEAKVVSDTVRRKIVEQRARAEEAARRGPLTERQIAQRKADMAAVMLPGETVTRALKRMGAGAGAAAAAGAAGGLPHRAMGKRERARLLAQQQQQQGALAGGASMASAGGADAAAREHFSLLTELADELLAEGELEIFSTTQEELIRSARMWLPQPATAALPQPAAAGAGPHGAAGAAAGKDNDNGDEDDMFADEEKVGKPGAGGAGASVDQDQDMFADDDEEDAIATAGEGAAGREVEGAVTVSSRANGSGSTHQQSEGSGDTRGALAGGVAAAPGAAPAQGRGNATDYDSWPVKELKRLLQERGVDPCGFVEKAELVAKAREVADAAAAVGVTGGAVGSGAAGDAAAFVAPPGYVYDPSSGYFYSEDAGMYYDASTGGYCQAATGKWYYLDNSSGVFVEWKQ